MSAVRGLSRNSCSLVVHKLVSRGTHCFASTDSLELSPVPVLSPGFESVIYGNPRTTASTFIYIHRETQNKYSRPRRTH